MFIPLSYFGSRLAHNVCFLTLATRFNSYDTRSKLWRANGHSAYLTLSVADCFSWRALCAKRIYQALCRLFAFHGEAIAV